MGTSTRTANHQTERLITTPEVKHQFNPEIIESKKKARDRTRKRQDPIIKATIGDKLHAKGLWKFTKVLR